MLEYGERSYGLAGIELCMIMGNSRGGGRSTVASARVTLPDDRSVRLDMLDKPYLCEGSSSVHELIATTSV